MMIKAVFFDLYHTLVSFDPPREEYQAQSLSEHGIKAQPEIFRKPLAIADEYVYQEISRLPLRQRSKEEQIAVWVKYQGIVLREAGIKTNESIVISLVKKMAQANLKVVPFSDVVPALSSLKQRGLITGLVSNVDKDIASLLKEIGLEALLDVVVTSQDAGVNKPNPEIFLKAVRKAGVKANESLYVGDQYQIDVMGANRAGMKGILIDRNGFFNEPVGSPKIKSLSELSALVPE